MEVLNTPHLLVIGGTGFIGHHLLRTAQQKGWQMTSVSLNPPSKERFVDSVRYLHFDLADRNYVKKYFDEDFDYVVNLGGYIDHKKFQEGGRELIDSHFTGLLNLIEWLPRNRLKSFVQFGSSDEYGDAIAPQTESVRESPISPYSLGKVAATHFLQMLHKTEQFPSVVLRLFLTYGPGQDEQRFIPQIIKGCLQDADFPVSAGEQLRDFCYVEDVVEAIIVSLEVKMAHGKVLNIASGDPVSIRNMIEKIRNIIKQGYPKLGKIPYRDGENMELYADVKQAEECIGWKAETTLDKGLEKTVDWYAKQA
jgi:nucleoside-diphosphate-sugar epimerase